jgi:dipeptidyl aminopeptidase/acylaminoacyl peptidase
MSYNTDVMSLIAAVKQTSYLNRNDINIWGQSMGGYIALRAAVLSPDIKTAILLASPVGTPQDMFKLYTPISDTDNITARNIRKNELAHLGTPISNPNFWDKASPINYLGSMRAYVMIFVGRQDRIVPYKFSTDLNSALTNSHKAHSYTLYTRGTHGLVPERQLIWRTSLKQLQQAQSQP